MQALLRKECSDMFQNGSISSPSTEEFSSNTHCENLVGSPGGKTHKSVSFPIDWVSLEVSLDLFRESLHTLSPFTFSYLAPVPTEVPAPKFCSDKM